MIYFAYASLIGLAMALLFLVFKMLFLLLLMLIYMRRPKNERLEAIQKIMDLLPKGRIVIYLPFSGQGNNNREETQKLKDDYQLLSDKVARLNEHTKEQKITKYQASKKSNQELREEYVKNLGVIYECLN